MLHRFQDHSVYTEIAPLSDAIDFEEGERLVRRILFSVAAASRQLGTPRKLSRRLARQMCREVVTHVHPASCRSNLQAVVDGAIGELFGMSESVPPMREGATRPPGSVRPKKHHGPPSTRQRVPKLVGVG